MTPSMGRQYGTIRTPSERPDCVRLWLRIHAISRLDLWKEALSQITTNHRRWLPRA